MSLRYTVLFLPLLAATPALAAPPACVGGLEIPKVRIIRAENNGVLVAEDGRAVRLEGVRLTDQGRKMLDQIAVGRALDMYATAPKEDRYDRVRAQAVFGNGDWLQQVLLARGLARVEMAPDRPQCASELYAAEKKAREAKAGLWAQAVNAVRSTNLPKGDTGTFQIIQGQVMNVEIRGGRVYLNFGTDYKKDFTVTISTDDRKIFAAAKVDPRSYAGKTIRVRGIVQYLNGPELEVAAPHQIEIVQ